MRSASESPKINSNITALATKLMVFPIAFKKLWSVAIKPKFSKPTN